MILSFHPCYEAERNIICAGRDPGAVELEAIRSAEAVILPQGCKKKLYEIAKENCQHVFPDYDMRFAYPNKIGQIKLFRDMSVLHPETEIYDDIDSFYRKNKRGFRPPVFGFPFVFKFDWGGEGETVCLIRSEQEYHDIVEKAEAFEKTGQKGFLIQEFVPCRNRTLRVAVIGSRYVSYWRVQKDSGCFGSALAKGAVIDHDSDMDIQKKAIASVTDFCKKTGINLAGFDILFSTEASQNAPFFLEINYFFGRKGLGGSEKFYDMLNEEINKWIHLRFISKNQI